MNFVSRSKQTVYVFSFALLLIVAIGAQSLYAASYVLIQVPNSFETKAEGINNLNQIVGWYFDSRGNQHGFLLSNGTYTPIDFPPGAYETVANGINDSGVIVGQYQTAPPNVGPAHGWIDRNGQFTQIDYPGAGGTFPIAINNEGVIVGYYQDTNSNYHAFKYVNGKFSPINIPNAVWSFAQGIDTGGNISGYYWVPYKQVRFGKEHGFILHSNGYLQTVKNPARPDATLLTGINDKLHAAGSYNIPNTSNFSGFVFAGGKFTSVNYPGGVSTSPQAINNGGMVVGWWTSQNGFTQGFLFMP